MTHDNRGGRPIVAVVGAGPAGLMAAEVAARGGAAVTVYDRMPSAGRKFLLAGRGGLNITHSEPLDAFLSRYGPASASLDPLLRRWTSAEMRAWCEALGQPTFVGSSGRVFPAAFKTSPLLRAWLRRLDDLGVAFVGRHDWVGWDEAGHLDFRTPQGRVRVGADAVVLALGGASWPQLGSDGSWAPVLSDAGIEVAALRPANCGLTIAWSDHFRDRFEGQPLKGLALTFGRRSVRGEALITRSGIEGGAVYALSAPVREALEREGMAVLHVSLRPDQTSDAVEARLRARPTRQSLSTGLRKALRLSPAAIALLREAERGLPVPLSAMEPGTLAAFLNAVPIQVTGTMPIAKAISTAGGVRFAMLDADLMLRQRPGAFAAGEMLDWEAPTGGYLLQACFATGVAAGQGALAWLQAAR